MFTSISRGAGGATPHLLAVRFASSNSATTIAASIAATANRNMAVQSCKQLQLEDLINWDTFIVANL